MQNTNPEFAGLSAPKPSVTLLKMDDFMPIGKHRGRLIRSILGNDADYLKWFRDNVDRYALAPDVCDTLDFCTGPDEDEDDWDIDGREAFWQQELGYGGHSDR